MTMPTVRLTESDLAAAGPLTEDASWIDFREGSRPISCVGDDSDDVYAVVAFVGPIFP